MSIETQRILLINCDCAIEEMMQLCFETIFNCKVIIASSGVDAIARVSTGQIEAILLDIDEIIPDLSWSEIIKDLQQNSLTNQIPIILLTSAPQSPEIVKLQQTRGIKAIAKSFDLLTLATQIYGLLNWDE
ncbi:response regulator [Pleurocapsa sp. CCALA 161]|uniref:response regulator n=1 Tax=Pleurocapsa sp. CCALA 161 TaxID=2107688 RepID=UPI00130492D3|nr:response regulator [Pleurocapsa sp. CCALA 161]